MLLHRRVVREIKRLLPGVAYYKLAPDEGVFCMPHKERVVVKRVGLTAVEVNTKLMITRGHPVYGFEYDFKVFRTTARRTWIARELRVLLSTYIEESAPSSCDEYY